MDIGHPIGAGDKQEEEEHRGVPELCRNGARTILEASAELQGQEGGAVKCEDCERREAAEKGIGVEQVEEAAHVVHIGVNGHAAQHVGKGHAQ